MRRISAFNFLITSEEVLASNKALWVSPDGKKLAYAKFDDSNVQSIKLPFYGDPGTLASQYTRLVDLKYPKVGGRFSQITINDRFSL